MFEENKKCNEIMLDEKLNKLRKEIISEIKNKDVLTEEKKKCSFICGTIKTSSYCGA